MHTSSGEALLWSRTFFFFFLSLSSVPPSGPSIAAIAESSASSGLPTPHRWHGFSVVRRKHCTKIREIGILDQPLSVFTPNDLVLHTEGMVLNGA
jgi:hypothetical protein